MLARTLVLAVAAAALFFLSSRGLERQAAELENDPAYNSAFEEGGEVLLHGLPGEVSTRLPLSGLAEALLLDHAGPATRRAALRLCVALHLVLVAAFCFALGAPAAAPPAVLLFWWGGWALFGRHPSIQVFYVPLSSLAALALAARAEDRSVRGAVVAGALLGASLLFRSALAFLPPLLGAWEWAAQRARPRPRLRARLLALCVLPYLFLTPWIVMNARVHRRFVPFEDHEADANIVVAALGGEHAPTLPGYVSRVEEAPDQGRAGAVLLWAAREIARHPVRYAEGYVRRAAFAVAQQPWLYLAGLAGFLLLRRRAAARALALFVAYVVGIHAAMAVVPAYFLPVFPVLCAAAAAGLETLLRRGRPAGARRWGGEAALAGAAAAATAACLAASWLLLAYPRKAAAQPAAALARELARHPDDGRLLYLEGLRRLEAGDARAAAPLLERSARALCSPDRSKAWAWARLVDGSPDEALLLDEDVPGGELEILKALASALKKDKADAAAHWQAARRGFVGAAGFWTESDREQADAEALRREREAGFETFAIGTASRYRSAESRARAFAALSSAGIDSPRLTGARAAAEAALGHEAAALRLMGRWPAEGAGAEGWHDFAMSCQQAGLPRPARAGVERLLSRRPGDAVLLKDLAILDYQDGRLESAAAELRRAVSADPSRLSAQLTLGYVEKARGRCREADEVYARALAVKTPREPELRPLLAGARRDLAGCR